MSQKYDIVVVGSGAAGLSTAIRAHDLGLSVVVLEAYSKIGGSTAYSAGQVWAGKNHVMLRDGMDDNLEDTKAYVKSTNHQPEMLDEKLLDQWMNEAPRVLKHLEEIEALKLEVVPGLPDYYYPKAPGSRPQGRYLAAAPISGKVLGDLRPKLLTSPHRAPGLSYTETFKFADSGDVEAMKARIAECDRDDILTFGTGIIVHLLAAVAKRPAIKILTEHRGRKLILDNGAVTGIEVGTPSGEHVTFNGTVMLATGSHDRDEELVREYSDLEPEQTGTVAPPGIRGDGHRMAKEAGGEMLRTSVDRAMHVPGYLVGEDYMTGVSATGWPHSIIVDSEGKRFSDDSLYHSITYGIVTGKAAKGPIYLVWDEDHHQKWGMAPAPPGGEYPESMRVKSAESVKELGDKLGISGEKLAATVEKFNQHARDGKDPEFNRGEVLWTLRAASQPTHKPNANLGPIEKGPFFGMELTIVNTGIGNGGVRTGLHGRVVDTKGKEIPGLYAAGVVASPTMMGSGYNSGWSICRGLTYGYLAAEDVAGRVKK